MPTSELRRAQRESDASARAVEVSATRAWMDAERFQGIVRLHGARSVLDQRGTIENDYPIARRAADRLYELLSHAMAQGQSITTFGPYSPGQAVTMKRLGIRAIYLGGWATSAKGSTTEDPGPDLASYPLNQVPDEAATVVRALLAADRNQRFARARMTDDQLRATHEIDFTPTIIADADAGHGGDAHVRNLIRRFIEVGVPGYHIEDQKPGLKKCGHQGGKVLVPCDEQIKRLNAARLQLDVMGVAGVLVARTDSEAADLLDGCGDERDQPFILGVTGQNLPPYKHGYLAVLRRLHRRGMSEFKGHLLYDLSEAAYAAADAWLDRVGVGAEIDELIDTPQARPGATTDELLDSATEAYHEAWERDADLKTYARAVAEALAARTPEISKPTQAVSDWLEFAATASWNDAMARAGDLGVEVRWDPELARTPEGFYQISNGIPLAVARSLAMAPFADLVWMETKTANLAEAREFAAGVHAVYPKKMLAYNLSPSFNWDTTGMSEEEMRRFPEKIGKLGYVFNFITYGGHQIDGLAAEEFTTALRADGMLALARLQRRFRLLESPYRTPQTLVGGPRADAALMAASGHTAATKAMGAGSTQVQHLAETEVPTRLLEAWLARWAVHNQLPTVLDARLRPITGDNDVLELLVCDRNGRTVANVIFMVVRDRHGAAILSVRDQNTFEATYRRTRLITLLHLWLIHRFGASAVHYLAPTADAERLCAGLLEIGLYRTVANGVGRVIMAEADDEKIAELVGTNSAARERLIAKGPVAA